VTTLVTRTARRALRAVTDENHGTG
jgi:hypothetical protein